MQFTNVFSEIAPRKEPIVILQGGTLSSKTFSILQLLLLKANKYPNKIFSIVSESMPHLRKGAMRDFFRLLQSESIYEEEKHNKTENSYRVGDSIIEFFGVEEASKLRGQRRDFLFINECNNVAYPIFQEGEIRTNIQCYLDFNPTQEFWVHQKILPQGDCFFGKYTYRDNKFADEKIIKSIEKRRETDPNWYRVFGMGEVGNISNIVFHNFDIVNEFPTEYKWLCYGMDFGFTNDPTALVAIALKGGDIYLHELIYETGLTNSDIAKRMNELQIKKSKSIYADSSEPKSIEEIYRFGFNIKPCIKGKDSVQHGINLMKQYKIFITNTSVNLIKEFRNYTYKTDKNEKILNEPIDSFNHGIDSSRYGITTHLSEPTGKYIIA